MIKLSIYMTCFLIISVGKQAWIKTSGTLFKVMRMGIMFATPVLAFISSFLLTLKALPRLWVALKTANLQSLWSRMLTSVSPFFYISSDGIHVSQFRSSSRSHTFYLHVQHSSMVLVICLSLTGTFFSHMTPVTSLHLFQASRTRFLQSVLDPPSYFFVSDLLNPLYSHHPSNILISVFLLASLAQPFSAPRSYTKHCTQIDAIEYTKNSA